MLRPINFLIAGLALALCGFAPASQSSSSGSQNAKPGSSAAAVKKSPLEPYTGTWSAEVEGREFMVVKLSLVGEQLSGSVQHPNSFDMHDDGAVKSFTDAHSTESLQSATLTGDGLLLTVKDDTTNEIDRFAMQLAGENSATMKMLAMSLPPGMPKPKPWKLTKVASGNPAPQAR
jgi:hypothetical protein